MHLVLTGKDFPVPFGIMPVSQDEYPLAPERVRYVGDPVAAVIAKDEQTANEALELIDVKYRPLRDRSPRPRRRSRNPEPRIHDYGEQGNIHRNQAYEFGDVEEALAKSDHVFEDLFFYEGNTHLPMEQHALARRGRRRRQAHALVAARRIPHYLHRQLARVLQMPAAHIRVIACAQRRRLRRQVRPGNHEIVVSKAALMLGRPVKICLTREEVFYMHRGRHPVLMKFRTGVTKDGKLTGDAPADAARRRRLRLARRRRARSTPACCTPVTYELPRFKFEACRVFTNKPPCGPKRGHGTPQPRFGQEVQLDKIAEKLGIDPAELRLNMVTKPDSLTANWLRIGSIGPRRMHPPGGRALGLEEQARQAARRARRRHRLRRLHVRRGRVRSTGTRCRTPACSCCSTAAAR